VRRRDPATGADGAPSQGGGGDGLVTRELSARRRSQPAARILGRLGPVEFTALLALSMSLAALGIDLMLPAFGAIRADLGLAPDATEIGGIVTAYFLGLAGGQLVYGPLSDRFGRKPALHLGYAVYALGALASAVSPTLPVLLASRVLWGFGAAGPRVVTLAVIRDTYDGEQMSRAMSFVMAVFVLVPVIGPSIGAAMIAVVSWRWLFAACLVAVLLMAVWAVRLPETLHPEHQLPLRFDRVAAAARSVVSDRVTVGYTFAMTALYAVFISYLRSAELIFGVTFDQTTTFPIIFGSIAAVMGGAMLVNARLVRRTGTRRLSHTVLIVYLVLAGGMSAIAITTAGRPPLSVFVACLAAMFACHALLIPNFNAIAMDPMAAVAGTASSIIGATQIAVGALLGSVIDRAFDGTILPLSLGFLGFGIAAAALVLVAEQGRLFALRPDPAALVPPPPTPEA
jgi:MFS transporter, DHA1 family, multidrug resistance protein